MKIIVGYTPELLDGTIGIVWFDPNGVVISKLQSIGEFKGESPNDDYEFIPMLAGDFCRNYINHDARSIDYYSTPALLEKFNICPLCKEKTTFTKSVLNYSEGNLIGEKITVSICDTCGLIRKENI